MIESEPMESDVSLFDKLAGIVLAYWPYMGMLFGSVLIIASRFRWQVLCQSFGVIILGVSIGALVSKT